MLKPKGGYDMKKLEHSYRPSHCKEFLEIKQKFLVQRFKIDNSSDYDWETPDKLKEGQKDIDRLKEHFQKNLEIAKKKFKKAKKKVQQMIIIDSIVF